MKVLIDSIVAQATQKIVQGIDQQIIDLLKAHGHEFETRAELEAFIKEHCRREIYPSGLNLLFLDNVQIVQWWDTFEIEQTGEKFTIIAGREPKNYKP